MSPIQRSLNKWILRVVSRPRLTLIIAAVVLAASVFYARRNLSVSTDQNNLFSAKVKFFHDYLEFDRKFPENQAIYVVVESADPTATPPTARWALLADRITTRLKGMPQFVKSVQSRVPLDQPGAPGILFDDSRNMPQHLQQLEDFVPLARLWGEKPSILTSILGRTPIERFLGGVYFRDLSDRQTLQFATGLTDAWVQTARSPKEPIQVGGRVPDLMTFWAEDPSDLGYIYVPDGDPKDPPHSLLLIRVYEKEDQSGLTSEADTIDAIRRATAEEAKGFPEFDVGLTGRPVLDADENRVTDEDGRRAEILSLAVVFVGLVLFLRSLWLALVAELTLAVAIGWTFGWATVSVGQLNLLSTVFLIALIGIGMDYLIQILSAYRRETRRYVRPDAVWTRVFRYVGPPVNTACFGAAGAFFVSVFTQFKGASELGIIAGGGLLLCLIAGYTVLPAVLVLAPVKLRRREPFERYPVLRPGRRFLVLPWIWVACLAAAMPSARRTQFNPNLLSLQAPGSSVNLVHKLQTWEAVVLSKDLPTLARVRSAVETAPTVAGTDSLLEAMENAQWLRQHAAPLTKIDWIDPAPVATDDLTRIAARSRALAARCVKELPPAEGSRAAESFKTFAGLLESAAAGDSRDVTDALSAWQLAFDNELKHLLGQFNPPPLELKNVPEQLRTHWVSGEGDYALYITPKENLWDRDKLQAFVRDVESRVATVPGAPAATGIAIDIYYTSAAIQKSFYQATCYSLALIFLLVLIDLKNLRHTLIAVSVLGLGLPMLVALMGALGVSWNFANFFGLPILIGAGHEYGVFMIHRYREALHDRRRVWPRWDPADRALLLCAFVTSSSFGFFWAISRHQGLKSLGLVMALGTACVYVATMTVVRPMLRWKLHKIAGRSAAGGVA